MKKTHDYCRQTWGHSINVVSISSDGTKARVVGFGVGVRAGDFLILPGEGGDTTRYMVSSIEYKRPADCWAADIEFAPRGAR